MNEDGETEDQLGDLFTLHDFPRTITNENKVVVEVDSNTCFLDSDSVLSFEDMETDCDDPDEYARESRQDASTSVLREEKSIVSRISMDDLISLSSKDPAVPFSNKTPLSPKSNAKRGEDTVKLSAEEHFKSLALAEAAAKSGLSEFTTESKVSVLDRMELEENIIRTIRRQERRKKYERFFNNSKNYIKKTMKEIRPRSPNKRFNDDQSQCSQGTKNSTYSEMTASQILGVDEKSIKSKSCLHFKFRDESVAVSYDPSISPELASTALSSNLFQEWVKKTSRIFGTKRVDVHGVTLKWIEFSGKDKKVECIKMEVNSTFRDEDMEVKSGHKMLSLCTLRINTVGLLVQLKCVEDGSTWSILVEQPRVPIGSVSTLELPPCILDDENKSIDGLVVDEMKKCGIRINIEDLVDLSKYAHESKKISIANFVGLCPLPGSSNECIQIMLSSHTVSRNKLSSIRSHMSELRDSGNLITFRIIPILDMWRVSMDVKVMCALFLMEKLNLSSHEPIAIGMKQSSIFSKKPSETKVGSTASIKSKFESDKKSSFLHKKVDPVRMSNDTEAEKNETESNKLQQASEAFDENREKLRRRMENMFFSMKSTLRK